MKKIKFLSFIFLLLLFITACTQPKTYTITFDSNGGSEVEAIEIQKGKTISLSDSIRENYTFDGWYTSDDVEFTSTTTVVEDITLYAKWTAVEYTITFISNGGSSVSPVTKEYGVSISSVANPTKERYTFDGWFTDRDLTNSYTLTTMPSEDITLYARWTITFYTITFNTNGGSNINPQSYEYGDEIEVENPTKDGYTFAGWYSNSPLTSPYTFTTMPARHLVVYAKWNLINYNITYNLDGGTNGANETTYTVDDENITLVNPTKDGYNFVGWYTSIDFSGESITSIDVSNERDITLYAKWGPNEFSLTFMLNDEANEIITTVNQIGSIITAIDDPDKNGYTFDGWYSDDTYTSVYSFSTMPAEDVTVYAKWNLNTYNISYELYGGTNGENPDTYTFEDDEITLVNPSKTGHNFLGWYISNDFYGNPTNKIPSSSSGHETFYAKWELSEYSFTYAYKIKFDKIVAGDFHNLGLSHDGKIYAWGSGNVGQLSGLSFSSTPIEINIPLSGNELIEDIFTEASTNFVITTSGRVFAWGNSYHGQLGDGTVYNNVNTPVDISSNFNLAANEFVVEIFAGLNHTFAKTSYNRIFAWGQNNYGQLGDGNISVNQPYPVDITSAFDLQLSEVIDKLSVGSSYSLALSSLGNVYSWGYNNGCLGNGTYVNESMPIDITSFFNLNDGETIIDIKTGNSHSHALSSQNRLFSWGNNGWGQLGNGTVIAHTSPLDITSFFNLETGEIIIDVFPSLMHSFVITSSRVFSWGNNGHGQLGDNSITYRTSPVDITSSFSLDDNEEINELTLGNFHSIAITSNERLFVWGANDVGQLGNGSVSNKYSPVELLESYQKLSHGEKHTIALNDQGQIFSWGNNDYGQLGDTTYVTRSQAVQITSYFGLENGEVIIDVIAGRNYSIAITSNNRIFAWGENFEGIISSSRSSTPIDVTTFFDFLNADETIKELFFGDYHAFGVTSNDRIFAWGHNNQGQLGDGTIIAANNPIVLSLQLSENESIVDFALGQFHTIARSSNNRIFAWGLNTSGQIGNGTTVRPEQIVEITDNFNLETDEIIIKIVAGKDHSHAITSNGRVFSWGNNDTGQLGNDLSGNQLLPVDITNNFNLQENEKVIDIYTGKTHSFAITSNDRVFAWGDNFYGKLGDGTTTDRRSPVDISSHFNLQLDETIVEIIADENFTFAITSNYRIFAWGFNDNGTLGIGDTWNPEINSFIDVIDYRLLKYNEEITDPLKLGYTFDGWYLDIELTIPLNLSNMPDYDLTVYAKWIQ